MELWIDSRSTFSRIYIPCGSRYASCKRNLVRAATAKLCGEFKKSDVSAKIAFCFRVCTAMATSVVDAYKHGFSSLQSAMEIHGDCTWCTFSDTVYSCIRSVCSK